MTARKSWVELQVQSERRSFSVGENINLTLTAKNISKNVAYLKFSSGQRFDVQVFRVGQNEPVYTWSASKMFIAALGQIVLKPGEATSFDATIGSEMGQLNPGKYRVEARLSSSSDIRALPFEIEIVQPAAQVKARTNKTRFKIGEPVEVRFSVQNVTNKPATFQFGSGQNYDVIVENEAGQAIWNWAANLRFIMVSKPVTFAPRETREFEVTWDGRALPDFQVKPGRYLVKAFYASTPPIFAEPVAIEIE